ncbi:MAG TPA: hypothetical protein P5307_18730, partial [Pirellulaceae bacterium]|nr:hypothetical protein [Pirellulaceae bacterium]
QPVFADGQTSVSTGLTNVNGLAFSDLDSNLWHQTNIRSTDPGHGINAAFDGSRPAQAGGASLYFGSEVSRDYDFAGGAQGTVVSNGFSLKGYSAADQPVLYFTYFSDLELDGTLQDSFRVYISSDDGDWRPLASNTPFAQTIHDNSNSWRQARIPLGDFAGQENLRLRFEFSTAGDSNVGHDPTTGDELRAVPGAMLRDGDVVVIDGQGYEFDLGVTLVAPSGASLTSGNTFDIAGNVYTFVSGSPADAFEVPFSPSDTAVAIAQRIQTAINATIAPGVAPIRSENRVNLVDNRIPRPGPLVVTAPALPSTFVEGVPGVQDPNNLLVQVNSGMTRTEVATQLKNVLENAFAEQVLLALDGSQFIDGDTFTLDDLSTVASFELDSGFTLSVPPGGARLSEAGIADGDTFTISDGGFNDVTFEFDKDGSFNPANERIPVTDGSSRLTVALQIESTINALPAAQRAALGLAPRLVANGLQIVGAPGTTLQIEPKSFVPKRVFASEQSGDNGSLPDAILTKIDGLGAVTVDAFIGDGPFAASSGDYDWYKVDHIAAGQIITARIDAVTRTSGSTLDAVIGIYDEAGTLLAVNDDDSVTTDSFLAFTTKNPGDYFVVVHGTKAGASATGADFQLNPSDSASGQGVGTTGAYTLTIAVDNGLIGPTPIPQIEVTNSLGDDGALNRAPPTDPSVPGDVVGRGIIRAPAARGSVRAAAVIGD